MPSARMIQQHKPVTALVAVMNDAIIKRHGLSIGIERVDKDFFVSLRAIGKLTHEDYEVITPMLDGALASVENANVRMIFDASQFDGWDLHAAWDDFRLGLRHDSEFRKVAVVGNQTWLEMATRIGAWFVSGEVRFFDSYNAAIDWLR